ncbi:MAG: hypothetical protein ACLQUY_24450 [Ktedonobacterales bacterium]
MMDETPPTQSSVQPLDHPMQDDSQDTPRESSPRGDDAPENETNQRWESDVEADQMEHLLGDEAIEDGGISSDEVADHSSDDS